MDDERVLLDGVGPRLRRSGSSARPTLTDLAEETGISVSTLSRLESGQRKPTLELLLPLARAHRSRSTSSSTPPRPATRGCARSRCPPRAHVHLADPPPRRAAVLQDGHAAVDDAPPPTLRTHEGYEWLYVLSGRMRLLLGTRTSRSSPARWSSSTPVRRTGSATPVPTPAEVLAIFGPQGERMHVRS